MARKKAANRASRQVKSRKKRLFLPYPLLIFLLLCAGVFLVAWTLKAGADNVLVTAKVSAPFVTQPADITTPTDGQHFTLTPIDVSGDCPPNAGYIEIFRNGVMAGTAICSNNVYDLSVDLLAGNNNLVVHVFNITDDEGPVGDSINVVYTPSQPSPRSPQPAQSNNPATQPLSLNTAFLYKGYLVGDQVDWPIQISGGSSPYAISVDWGDDTSDLISRPQAGEFKINHVYDRPGPNQGSFTIKIKASDSDGQSRYLQFFVIINANKSPGITSTIFSKPTPQISSGLNWLWVAWPAYGVVVLMTVSFLLGEKEELLRLGGRGLIRRR